MENKHKEQIVGDIARALETDEQIIQLWNSTQISVAELAKRSNRTVKYLATLGIPT